MFVLGDILGVQVIEIDLLVLGWERHLNVAFLRPRGDQEGGPPRGGVPLCHCGGMRMTQRQR